MKMLEFEEGMDAIYAIFGKRSPEGRVLDVIWERIRWFPDGFMAYAKQCLENEEKLPVNLGRYLVDEVWPAYRQTAGIQTIRDCDCQECQGDRYISAYAPDGISWSFPCICRKPQGGYTRKRILELGYSFKDPLIGKYPPNPRLNKTRKALASLGQEFPVRQRHAEYMQSEAEF